MVMISLFCGRQASVKIKRVLKIKPASLSLLITQDASAHLIARNNLIQSLRHVETISHTVYPKYNL